MTSNFGQVASKDKHDKPGKRKSSDANMPIVISDTTPDYHVNEHANNFDQVLPTPDNVYKFLSQTC